MLYTIIVILLILWLLGYFGPNVFARYSAYGQFRSHLARHRGHPPYFESVGDRVDPYSVENERGGPDRLTSPHNNTERKKPMLYTVVIVLIVLFLIGYLR